MTADILTDSETFHRQLKQLFLSQDEQDGLAPFRKRAWDHFEELGLPTVKTETFQYLRLRRLFDKQFQLACSYSLSKQEIAGYILPPCARSCAVFVNGQLDLRLSSFEGLPKKVVAICLQEAFRSFGSFINNQVARFLREEMDPFAALNAAFQRQALFFYVPPNTVIETPIQILHLLDGQNALYSPRSEFFFGALSEAQVIRTVVRLNGAGGFLNDASHFAIEEGAKITYSRVICPSSSSLWHFDATRTTLKKDSSFKSYIVQEGAEAYRDDYRISLIGPNAEVYLGGVWMLKNKAESHTHVYMDHQSPHCRSMQLFKGILDDSSRSSFEGKIYIHKAAQKTQAFQLNHNLLLSDAAQSDSKPNLEIFADDVKASHGATVGQLDPEHLFYLSTRGLNLNMAKHVLIQGFCHEVIDQIPVAALRTLAADEVAERH